jgi:WD40 repeat protein
MLRKTGPYALFKRLLSILIGIAMTVATAPPMAQAAQGPYREVLRIGRGTVDSFAWRPDSKALAVAGSLGVWIYTTDFQDIRYIPRTQEPSAGKIPVIWQPDGQHIATTGPRHTVEIYDAETGQLVLTYAGHTLPIASLAWSPDGTRIASASIDGTLHVWDTLTGQLISAAKEDKGVVPLAWSPDGKQVAGDGIDRNIQIWDVTTGDPVGRLYYSVNHITQIAWSPDGKLLAGTDEVKLSSFS